MCLLYLFLHASSTSSNFPMHCNWIIIIHLYLYSLPQILALLVYFLKCREKLDDVFKIKRERSKGIIKYVREFHKKKERIHRERIDRIQREKINLLKINDVEGYLRMVQVGLFSYYISRQGRIHKY